MRARIFEGAPDNVAQMLNKYLSDYVNQVVSVTQTVSKMGDGTPYSTRIVLTLIYQEK